VAKKNEFEKWGFDYEGRLGTSSLKDAHYQNPAEAEKTLTIPMSHEKRPGSRGEAGGQEGVIRGGMLELNKKGH